MQRLHFAKCFYFTLTLLEPKVIGISWYGTIIEPGQHSHPCSLTWLCTISWHSKNSHIEIPKIDNGQL